MLTINITPSFIYIKNLSPDLLKDIQKNFSIEFEFKNGKHYVCGTPEKLYKTLYLLATTYDVELI